MGQRHAAAAADPLNVRALLRACYSLGGEVTLAVDDVVDEAQLLGLRSAAVVVVVHQRLVRLRLRGRG